MASVHRCSSAAIVASRNLASTSSGWVSRNFPSTYSASLSNPMAIRYFACSIGVSDRLSCAAAGSAKKQISRRTRLQIMITPHDHHHDRCNRKELTLHCTEAPGCHDVSGEGGESGTSPYAPGPHGFLHLRPAEGA